LASLGRFSSLIELRAAYMPDALEHSQDIPKLVPEEGSPPILASSNPLSTLHACRDHRLDVSATLTTWLFDRSTLRWLEINT
jgi:hypothetical protein